MKQVLQYSILGILIVCFLNVPCNNTDINKTEKIETFKEANIDYKSKNIENMQSAY